MLPSLLGCPCPRPSVQQLSIHRTSWGGRGPQPSQHCPVGRPATHGTAEPQQEAAADPVEDKAATMEGGQEWVAFGGGGGGDDGGAAAAPAAPAAPGQASDQANTLQSLNGVHCSNQHMRTS